MKIAILDPASGIAGDMFIGALVDNGLDKAWLERLPATLGLDQVGVRIADVQRSGVRCESGLTYHRSRMDALFPRSID
jgi:uncharacterized protein (DUF111 family)